MRRWVAFPQAPFSEGEGLPSALGAPARPSEHCVPCMVKLFLSIYTPAKTTHRQLLNAVTVLNHSRAYMQGQRGQHVALTGPLQGYGCPIWATACRCFLTSTQMGSLLGGSQWSCLMTSLWALCDSMSWLRATKASATSSASSMKWARCVLSCTQ